MKYPLIVSKPYDILMFRCHCNQFIVNDNSNKKYQV